MTSVAQSRLYIVAEAGTAPGLVEAAIEACGAPALLIAPAPGAGLEAPTVRPLVELAQARGVAALIESDARLARTLRADGVHLPWSKNVVATYREAREVLGTRFVVGADAGRSRDDAMTLGEEGADYVGFGIPAHVEDRAAAGARRHDLVAWWSEIFEVPCVAFDVEAAEAAAALARAGADFVALRLPAGLDAGALARWAEDAAAAIAVAEDVA